MASVQRVSAMLAICLLPLASPALANPYSTPEVIPGIGPGMSPADGRMEPLTAPPRGEARPTPAVGHQAGNLGGGFIEFLMTGRSAPARESQPRFRQPGPAPYMASYAPDGGDPGSAAALATPADPVRPQPGYAAPRKVLDPVFVRQEVPYKGPHAPGTIVIDTQSKFLYLVESGGQALRYGIGVGRPGFLWAGEKTITRKAEWPDWTPPSEMLKRRPDLPSHMNGGIANPLGARAMYLGSSLYRIHGTNEPDTIGTNVSSGCIRLTNDDVTDLYSRVGVGTRVIVMGGTFSTAAALQ